MQGQIDGFDVHIELEVKRVCEEFKSGKYSNYRECPSYSALKNLVDGANILRQQMKLETLNIEELLED